MVSEQPSESLKKKRQRSPFLTGVNSAETSRAVFGNHFVKCYTIVYETCGLHVQQFIYDINFISDIFQ